MTTGLNFSTTRKNRDHVFFLFALPAPHVSFGLVFSFQFDRSCCFYDNFRFHFHFSLFLNGSFLFLLTILSSCSPSSSITRDCWPVGWLCNAVGLHCCLVRIVLRFVFAASIASEFTPWAARFVIVNPPKLIGEAFADENEPSVL